MEELDEELDMRKAEEKASAELEMARRIREKEMNKQMLEQRRKLLEAEREKKLQIARDQRRHLTIIDDEEEIRPKLQPHVDRSVKPPATSTIQRDFHPEYGSMVGSPVGLWSCFDSEIPFRVKV